MWRRSALALAALVSVLVAHAPAGAQRHPGVERTKDWALAEGFALEIDSDGYTFPSAIAFVPEPGQAPGDPLYFVTELRGTVKVVTNDRSVHVFAEDFFGFVPEEELPARAGEAGMAGICLAPERGYVFVTFAYHDEHGHLRNNIMRFQSVPRTFSLTPTSRTDFTGIFSAFEIVTSHQIGPCQVHNDALYVGVGDAEQPRESQRLDTPLGKILRMSLDGEPLPDNPFYVDNDVRTPRNYVWAYGLRNPFGLRVMDGHVYVADNGRGIDRFIRIEPGRNYLWDGNDRSIAAAADVVLPEGDGVAQFDRYPPGLDHFPPGFRESFFLTITGSPDGRSHPRILQLPYTLEGQRALAAPREFLAYRGGGAQIVPHLAFGPDGLYFLALFDRGSSPAAVYKVQHRPEAPHPFTLRDFDPARPTRLIFARGCFGCHVINERRGGTAGPDLSRRVLIPRLEQRLHSRDFLDQLAKVDRLDEEPFASFRDARREVREARGRERIKTWLTYKIVEPRFDGSPLGMPNLGVSREEARLLAEYLAGTEGLGVGDRIRGLLPSRVGRRHLAVFAGAAFLLGFLAFPSTVYALRQLGRHVQKGRA